MKIIQPARFVGERALPASARSRYALDAVAIVCGLGVGVGFRAVLQPLLGDTVPFVLAFAAVCGVSAVRGPWIGAATAALCAVWIALPWLPPAIPEGQTGWIQVALLFLASSLFIAVVTGRMRLNRREEELRLAPAKGRRGFYVLALTASAVPILFFGVVAWIGYRNAIDEGYARLERTARIGTEHIQRVIETNEVIARTLLARMGDATDDEVLAGEAEYHRLVQSLERDLHQIQSIWVLGAGGRALVSSRFYPAPRSFDFSDREYFRAHRDSGVDWYVTEVLVSRSTGEPFFDVTRIRKRSGGAFGGVINVSLRPGYFSEFYKRLAQDEPGLTLALLRDDGAIIARWPEDTARTARLGEQSPTLHQMRLGADRGRVYGVSSVDGRERFAAFARTGAYPLYVAAALDRDSLLSGWYSRTAVLGGIAFPAALTLAWLSLLAMRRRELERAAQEKLLRESEFRAQAEEALRQAQKLEALGRLTGGVAHDFNNLLMVLNNNVFLEQRMQPDGMLNPRLGAMRRAVETGTKLTRQLLAFAGRQATVPTSLRLQDFIPSLREMLQTTVGGGVELTTGVEPGTPPIKVDPAELELAIINLALNATDAMSASGSLSLSAAAIEGAQAGLGDQRYAALSVSDTGHGIPAEIADKVFDPFFTTKASGEGTGLGLSQVYGFCAQAGGGVRLSSAQGGGTVVTMYLPAVEWEALDPPAVENAKTGSLCARVLLVEDNADVANTTSELIRQLGCEVERVRSGDEARALLARDPGRFDIVLSDVVMPGKMNGIDLARHVREHWPSVPIVLMTGYAPHAPGAGLEGIELMPKPLEPEALARALARHARSR